MVESLTSRKGGRLALDGTYDYFNTKVKQDCTEGATLFDAGQDGDRVGGFRGCSDGGGGSSIGTGDQRDEGLRDANVLKGGSESAVGSATKSIAKVEPGDVGGSFVNSGISDDGFE